MKKNKKLNLGKIRVVNLNVTNSLRGGGESDADESCGDRRCGPEVTNTNTDTKDAVCGSLDIECDSLFCVTTD
ncbi:hypothetical protein [Kordia periserrulae]|nr:hypothetical protein [Kordia periserrulae]